MPDKPFRVALDELISQYETEADIVELENMIKEIQDILDEEEIRSMSENNSPETWQ